MIIKAKFFEESPKLPIVSYIVEVRKFSIGFLWGVDRNFINKRFPKICEKFISQKKSTLVA